MTVVKNGEVKVFERMCLNCLSDLRFTMDDFIYNTNNHSVKCPECGNIIVVYCKE